MTETKGNDMNEIEKLKRELTHERHKVLDYEYELENLREAHPKAVADFGWEFIRGKFDDRA